MYFAFAYMYCISKAIQDFPFELIYKRCLHHQEGVPDRLINLIGCRRNLRSHMAYVHKTEGSHVCQECGKSFPTLQVDTILIKNKEKKKLRLNFKSCLFSPTLLLVHCYCSLSKKILKIQPLTMQTLEGR